MTEMLVASVILILLGSTWLVVEQQLGTRVTIGETQPTPLIGAGAPGRHRLRSRSHRFAKSQVGSWFFTKP